MKVIIVGAGEVGLNLARKLSSENHEVVIIEKDENTIDKYSDQINSLFIHGSGTSIEILEEAGIDSTDIFIAATNYDEVNLISCFIASKYNIPHIIARLNKEDLPLSNYKQLGINQIINTNTVVVNEIINLIQFEGAHEFIQFENGQVLLFGFIIEKNNPFIGKSLIELNEYRKKIPFLIACIYRDNQVIIPKGYDKIQENDHILLLTLGKNLSILKRLFLKKRTKLKKIFILGASKIGKELAKQLEKIKDLNIIIADKDYSKCLELNEYLENSLILNLDGLDVQSIITEQLDNSDIFISTTNNDEVNIVACTCMKQLGVKKTIAIIRRSGYSQFMNAFGIDVILSPRLLTASNILQYARKGEIIKAIPLLEENAEIIEFKVSSDNLNLINKKVSELNFPSGSIICAIIRDDKAIIPSGDTVIKKDDKLVVLVKSELIMEIQELLQ